MTEASGLAVHAALADEFASMARHQAAADPAARGADWRLAVVATVDSDGGTITTTDGITARRMDTYRYPAAGDVVVISVSSSGNWLAAGRLAPSSGNGWKTPSLVSPWENYGGSYQDVRYRRDGPEVVIQGLVRPSTSVSGNLTIFNLPSDYAPPGNLVFSSVGNDAASQQFNVYASGEVSSIASSGTSYLSLNCRFSIT